MKRLPSAAVLSLAFAQPPSARAAGDNQECAQPLLAALGRQLQVAHFAPGPGDHGTDPAGVVLASSCKRMPDDPRLTLAAVAWDAHKDDAKALVVAIVDESVSRIEALRREESDEDGATRILEDYDLAIGLGEPGKNGWRDLSLTASARRSDHKPRPQAAARARALRRQRLSAGRLQQGLRAVAPVRRPHHDSLPRRHGRAARRTR